MDDNLFDEDDALDYIKKNANVTIHCILAISMPPMSLGNLSC